jgi:hypothetical protein
MGIYKYLRRFNNIFRSNAFIFYFEIVNPKILFL